MNRTPYFNSQGPGFDPRQCPMFFSSFVQGCWEKWSQKLQMALSCIALKHGKLVLLATPTGKVVKQAERSIKEFNRLQMTGLCRLTYRMYKAHGLDRLNGWRIRFAEPRLQVSGSTWLIHLGISLPSTSKSKCRVIMSHGKHLYQYQSSLSNP